MHCFYLTGSVNVRAHGIAQGASESDLEWGIPKFSEVEIETIDRDTYETGKSKLTTPHSIAWLDTSFYQGSRFFVPYIKPAQMLIVRN